MANAHVPRPKMKEKNPGWKGSRTGTKVRMLLNPLGVRVLPGNPTQKGGIFRKTKGKAGDSKN